MSPRPLAHRHRTWIAVIVLGVVGLLPYLQVAQHDYIYYDDPDYVIRNPVVQEGLTLENIRWAFTTRAVSNWHPLTWLSYLLDYELFGLNPGAQLLVNVAFHLANGLLLYALLMRLLLDSWGRSLFAAALFLAHPLHVESVGWVSERKDVLSAFFFLLSLIAYVRYAQLHRAAAMGWYVLSLLTMALGLMAKPMVVTLPFVFLLLDFWPLARMRRVSAEAIQASPGRSESVARLIIEKVPFLVLALVSSVLTMWAQREAGSLGLVSELTLPLRLANAMVAYAAYVIKTFWPVDLTPFYPHPIRWPAGQVLASLVLIGLITTAALKSAPRRPCVLFGWLWFLGTLVPVIGIVQAGAQWMADRYTYIPLIGPFIAIAWLAHDALGAARRVEIAAATVVVLVLMGLTFAQVRRWENSLTLFSHNLSVVGDNVLAHNILGHYYDVHGQPDKAIEHFDLALALKPNDFKSNYNMAVVLARFGHPAEAIGYFERALRVRPRDPKLMRDFAQTLENAGQDDRARAMLEAARAIDPDR